MLKGFGIKSGALRTTYLKSLNLQYRGMIASLDEGLTSTDSILASAIWRNVFNADADIDYETLAAVVAYVRRCASGLGKVSDEVIEGGQVFFGNPEEEIRAMRTLAEALPSLQDAN